MTQTIQLGQTGVLRKISQGGQGVVYRAPSVRTTFAKSMVYKEYKPGVLASLNVDALKAMPEFLESLPYRDGAKLISLASWPCAIIENAGRTTGFVMPSIPDEFFIDFWTSNKSTPSRVAAEFQHLLNDPQVLAMRFAGMVITDRQRYELLREAASALLFLDDRGVCCGDISPKNLLFSLAPSPAVYFIDCDAMRVNGVSLSHQVETPGWQVPAGEEKATVYSDRYKLGLLALRLCLGSQDAKDPGRLPRTTPAALRQVITDTLTKDPQQRPDLATWDQALAKAIAAAPKQTATAPRPAVPPTVVVKPPTRPTPTAKPTAYSRPPISAPPPARTNPWPAVLITAIVGVVVVVVAVVIAGLVNNPTDKSPSTATSTANSQASADPNSPAATSSTRATRTAASETALQQMQSLRSQDEPDIERVADQWIPQLSSKHGSQPWTYDPEDAVLYTPERTLQEHQQLRYQYGAKLVWSGDWTTWDHPDYWVTVVPQTFPDAASVRRWCASNGRSTDHCSAQIVSKTRGTSGTHG